jgi:hypothetical protein
VRGDIPQLRAKSILVFAVHQIGATWGVGIGAYALALFLFGILRPLNPGLFGIHNMYHVLSQLPYFPIQILLGFSWGWALSLRFRHRSMLWVWVLPFVILCYAVAEVPTLTPGFTFTSVLQNQSPVSHYFGWACRQEDRCIDQLLVTMPFYASAAYSIGALIARRTRAGIVFALDE